MPDQQRGDSIQGDKIARDAVSVSVNQDNIHAKTYEKLLLLVEEIAKLRAEFSNHCAISEDTKRRVDVHSAALWIIGIVLAAELVTIIYLLVAFNQHIGGL